jgi:hypothetical protein
MKRQYLLIVTALSEGATGLLLLCLPSVVLTVLLGTGSTAPEATLAARIAGAALVAIGIICWSARSDDGQRAQLGLLVGVLTYDVAAAAILAYAGLAASMVGIALWPAVGAHVALAAWCVVCLQKTAAVNLDS